MSLSKLALVVFALLAGTAVSVQSYLESRRPIVLSPRVLLRDLPSIPWAPRPEPSDAAPASSPAAVLTELAGDPSPGIPTVAAPLPVSTRGVVVELESPEPEGRVPDGDVSRWITVRRDGAGRASGCGPSSRSRRAGGCSSGVAAPSPAAASPPAASAAQVAAPTQVRLD